MDDLIVSLIALVMTAAGAGAVFLMLEVRGNPKDPDHAKKLISRHKIFGYAFTAIFALMSAGMIIKTAQHDHEMSARVMLHIALGLTVICLLAIKLLMARRHKKLADKLLGVGLIIFVSTFVMTAVTAGYFFMHISEELGEEHESENKAVTQAAKDDGARALFEAKCAKCHGLEKALSKKKTKDQWSETVKKMAGYAKDPNFLSDTEKEKIVDYLSSPR